MATEEPLTSFNDGTLHIDFAQREVTLDGQPVHMSPRHYPLFDTLVRRQGQPVSPPELIALLWGDDVPDSAFTDISMLRSVQGNISMLRSRLSHGSRDHSAMIETVVIETVTHFRFRSQP